MQSSARLRGSFRHSATLGAPIGICREKEKKGSKKEDKFKKEKEINERIRLTEPEKGAVDLPQRERLV